MALTRDDITEIRIERRGSEASIRETAPLKPLPPDYPIIALTVAEITAARAAGHLAIHDNGVLTLHQPGEPVRQIATPSSPTTREGGRRHPLTAEHKAAMTAGRAAARARRESKVPDREETPPIDPNVPERGPASRSHREARW